MFISAVPMLSNVTTYYLLSLGDVRVACLLQVLLTSCIINVVSKDDSFTEGHVLKVRRAL